MEWLTRLKIALGAAKGLAYLHEDCHPNIIHRDIKTTNILLDFKFEAMLADFGLAKITSDNNTHVSTRVMGTFGVLGGEFQKGTYELALSQFRDSFMSHGQEPAEESFFLNGVLPKEYQAPPY